MNERRESALLLIRCFTKDFRSSVRDDEKKCFLARGKNISRDLIKLLNVFT